MKGATVNALYPSGVGVEATGASLHVFHSTLGVIAVTTYLIQDLLTGQLKMT